MIVAFALTGLFLGWLLHVAADVVPSLSGAVQVAMPRLHAPALLRPFDLRDARLRDALKGELLLELLMAALLVTAYLLHDASVQSLTWIGGVTFFALIAVIDIRYRVIPNLLTYPGIAVALFANIVLLQRPPLPVVLGMVFAFGIFYLVARLRPDELGGGDIKLAALLGAIFGFPLVLWVLIVSVVTSGAAIFYLLSAGNRTLRDTIPYAPFLCLGAVTVILCSSLFGA